MCFVLDLATPDSISLRAPWLLQLIALRSVRRHFNQMASRLPLEQAINSASSVERATTVCPLACQLRGVPLCDRGNRV